ncbi:MAG TPA: phosphoglycerate kinase [Longimicrobiales bacterium]|nr:phosphoglycerate kinase [Longimicrobiales bacterium]
MPARRLSTFPPDLLEGRKVLVRADLNVPLRDGSVADDTRIRASIPTLDRLTDAGASVLLMSHLGRPDGAADPAYSLAPVAERLGEFARGTVSFVGATVGDEVEDRASRLGPGEILLLENTRFLPGETKNDPELAARLGALADMYVNDAFGTAHRAHASTEGVARVVKERGGLALAGLLLERELRFLGEALDEPERPFVAILGGAKISGKIDVVEALLPRVDGLLIGGAMANTFLLALGLEVGESLVEEDRVEMARDLMERAGDRLVLPVDCRVASEISPTAAVRVVPRDGVGDGHRIGDIGPETEALFRETVLGARTLVWNGPMGVFEMAPFAEGTLAVARAVADATDEGAVSVLGGGDSAAAAEAAGVSDRLTHVSTGGGASLEFLAGRVLPGVAVLSQEDA